jgi:hypothetical protein
LPTNSFKLELSNFQQSGNIKRPGA